MSAHVIINLDTRPPVPAFSEPVRDGGTIRIPFTINEPAIVAAEINGVVAFVGDDDISATLQQQQGGTVNVRAFVKDEVDNSAVVEFVFGMKPVQGWIEDPKEGVQGTGRTGRVDRSRPGRVESPDEGDVL